MATFIERYRADFRANLILALPIMAGQLGQVVVNVVDNIMVGRLGSAALASMSLSLSIYVVFLIVGLGISYALPPLLAEADGSKNYDRISPYFYHSLIINLVYSFLAIGCIEMIIPFLDQIGHEPEVVALSIPYLRISAYALIPMMVFQTFRCYADGLSHTKPPMVAMIIGNLFNVFFNYVLIFGKLGMPAMGVRGAAIGTLLARIIMMAVLMIILAYHTRIWRYLKAEIPKIKKAVFMRLFKLGIPTSLQMFFEVTGFAGAALLMGMISKEAQAAHQVAINLSAITFLICTGLGMACTVRVGNNLGEGDRLGMHRAGISAIIQVVIFMMMCAIVFVTFRSSLPTMYINDTSVISIAAVLLIMAALFQIPDGVQVVALGALRGLQDVRIPTLITFIAYWLVGLPTSYLAAFYFDFGPIGIWLGLVFGLSISAALLTLRFYRMSR